ncbi:MAG: hypothetical protein ACE5KK_02025, partial [Candidatus Brocadiales bacterium]
NGFPLTPWNDLINKDEVWINYFGTPYDENENSFVGDRKFIVFHGGSISERPTPDFPLPRSYSILILTEGLEKVSFLGMEVDKAKRFLEQNPKRKLKMRVYWRPIYAKRFDDVVFHSVKYIPKANEFYTYATLNNHTFGRITKVEIFTEKDELVRVFSNGEEGIKQIHTIELPEKEAQVTAQQITEKTVPQQVVTTYEPPPYSGEVYAAKLSQTFHHPDCPEISGLEKKDLVSFSSANDAIQAGGIACQTCKPLAEEPATEETPKGPFEGVMDAIGDLFGGSKHEQ